MVDVCKVAPLQISGTFPYYFRTMQYRRPVILGEQ